jgi:hypothetical protein
MPVTHDPFAICSVKTHKMIWPSEGRVVDKLKETGQGLG